jgi:hypothetical protein
MRQLSRQNRTAKVLVHDANTGLRGTLASKLKFLAWSALAIPILVAPVLLVVFLLLFGGNQVARELLVDFSEQPIDIVYFGDSVVRAFSGCEARTHGIDDLLRASAPSTIATVAGAGYTAQQYTVLSGLFDVTEYKPRTAVIPINMRSLSLTWGENPDWQFGADMQYVRILSGNWQSIPPFVATSLFDDKEEEREVFLQKNVTAAAINYGSLEKLAEQAAGVPLNLECEANAEIYEDALRAKFTINYMFDLQRNHPLLGTLVTLANDLQNREISSIFYLTPINVVDGTALVGPAFRDTLARNVSVIAAVLEENGIEFLDMTHDLPGAHFSDKGCACEHLTFEGRQHVASRLSKALADHPAAAGASPQ